MAKEKRTQANIPLDRQGTLGHLGPQTRGDAGTGLRYDGGEPQCVGGIDVGRRGAGLAAPRVVSDPGQEPSQMAGPASRWTERPQVAVHGPAVDLAAGEVPPGPRAQGAARARLRGVFAGTKYAPSSSPTTGSSASCSVVGSGVSSGGGRPYAGEREGAQERGQGVRHAPEVDDRAVAALAVKEKEGKEGVRGQPQRLGARQIQKNLAEEGAPGVWVRKGHLTQRLGEDR